ncbi:MAG: T9SS type A sorting domain-containing protein [bacterium]|nr:MAG: T9SS type A sorting domain-containing protein [bacterium]
MASRLIIVPTLILLAFISLVPLVLAGNRWNNPRDLDPVIVSDNFILGLSGVPINEIYVYAYDAGENSWRPIPFQIDEQDNTSDFWLPTPNGIFDGNDELVFMAKDMGDQAPDGSFWIDDPISRDTARVEITVMDPADGSQAWVYVYQTTNPLPLAPDSYVNYIAADSAGADTIVASSYIEGHSYGGIPTDWLLLEGAGIDILDRQKAWIGLVLYDLWDFQTNEAFIETFFDIVKIKAGPVRLIREVFWHIDLGIPGFEPFDFSMPLMYYPYSIESGGVSGTLDTGDHVYLIRQSFDLNQDASGMNLYNPYNRNGILIDGVGGNDGIDSTVVDFPAVNWWLITGDQGSYAIVFRLSELGDNRVLYYKDDSTLADESEDTGDRRFWGDTGIKITGTDIAGNISFAYNAYYLGPNKSDNLGDTLATNFENPLQISYQINNYVPVELAFFKAMDSEGKVVLEWVTETETNNYGFEIQRKTQKHDDWSKIGSVKGQGTTTTPHKYFYTDHNVAIGTYYYRLKQLDFDGSFEFSDEIQIDVKPPRTFSLHQNYPNPFNPETVIRYRIPGLDQAMVAVELKIYNLLGDEVRALVQKDQGAGYYSITWDGRNNQGKLVTAGTYLYRLQAGEFVKTNKMLLLR